MTREEQLMDRISRGDRDAAEQLVQLLYPELLRYCLWHVPRREEAEDAVQETFLKALRYYDRYVHRGSCRAFLYRIAANTCIDIQRRSAAAAASIEALDELPEECAPLERAQEDWSFRQRIRLLKPEQQELVLLRFGQELSLREIAAATGLPLRTVQSRLRAALKQLKKQLEQEESP